MEGEIWGKKMIDDNKKKGEETWHTTGTHKRPWNTMALDSPPFLLEQHKKENASVTQKNEVTFYSNVKKKKNSR